MSAYYGAGLVPMPVSQHGLLAIATGLRVGRQGKFVDIFELRPDVACRNAVSLLARTSSNLDVAINILGPFVLVGYGIYKYVWRGLSMPTVVDWLSARFVSRITIPSDHHLNGLICQWVVKQGLTEDPRALVLDNTVDLGRRMDQNEGDNDPFAALVPRLQGGMNYAYFPAVGTTKIAFENKSFWFTRIPPGKDSGASADHHTSHPGRPPRGTAKNGQSNACHIEIACFSPFRGVEPIRNLIAHIYTVNNVNPEKQTTIMRPRIYDGGQPSWDFGTTRPARTLDSVTMDAARKSDVVQDMTKYLSTQSQKWYSERGIPWRRGYLFYGPPGTGKTSFCTALAGHFSLTIYVISLSDSDLDDKALEALFDGLPAKCIVLLEDIDSAGIRREQMKVTKKGKRKRGDEASGITLAGLLNIVDGPCAREGRVMVLTTNSPDSLDAALLRPGRIDKKVLFGNASHEVIAGLFLRTYQDSQDQQPEEVKAISAKFASKMPPDALTPAEIQGFLLLHRESPGDALDLVEEWARNVLATKDAGRNVDTFRDQVAGGKESPGAEAEVAEGTKGRGSTEDEDESSSSDGDGQTSALPGHRSSRGPGGYIQAHRYIHRPPPPNFVFPPTFLLDTQVHT